MDRLELLRSLAKKSDSKIVLLIIDGLGGLPGPYGKTELEAAAIPNLDSLVSRSVCGLMDPVGRGITPGSGPGHLALFGYDPVKYEIGRGALEAAGAGFHLEKNDVASRVNFCTLDEKGSVSDRRAGRISTQRNQELVKRLREITIPGTEIFVETIKEHRALVVFRGEGLGDKLNDTDPQTTGVPPLEIKGEDPASKKTANLVREFLTKARAVLKDASPANGLLMRGFSKFPELPTLQELYGLRPAAIATYPMYRGVAKYAGMEVLSTGTTFSEEVDTLGRHLAEYDFFFVHYKYTDSRGEDGDFEAKAKCLEEVDAEIGRLDNLRTDVLVVTGDHSTPATFRAHSWHPVPVMLRARFARVDRVKKFNEFTCAQGGLGRFPTQELMALMLAHAGRLEKFGA